MGQRLSPGHHVCNFGGLSIGASLESSTELLASQGKMQYITKFCAGQVETIVLIFCVHDVSQQNPGLNSLCPDLEDPRAIYYFSDIHFPFLGKKKKHFSCKILNDEQNQTACIILI